MTFPKEKYGSNMGHPTMPDVTPCIQRSPMLMTHEPYPIRIHVTVTMVVSSSVKESNIKKFSY